MSIENKIKFWIGIATPFITCIPTEVSEHWFAGRQRTVITAVLGMGDCFGLILGKIHNVYHQVWNLNNIHLKTIKCNSYNFSWNMIGQGITPLFVHSAEDVPLMNLVWFLPAVIGCIVTALKVYLSKDIWS